MKQFKGTKGEWILDHSAFTPNKEGVFANWIGVKNNNGNTLAEAKGFHYSIPDNECEANAKLIAAAPELLEALELIISNSNDHAIIRIASKAINKALD